MKLQINATVLKLLHQRISGESLLPCDRPFSLLRPSIRAINMRLSRNQRVTDKQNLSSLLSLIDDFETTLEKLFYEIVVAIVGKYLLEFKHSIT